jgi:menaquinone-dependent protoporphyrinogen IX oxidase
MLGIYLSGTGNTKHCIEKLIHLLDETAQAIPIEREDAVNELSKHDFIVLAYPVQFFKCSYYGKRFYQAAFSPLEREKGALCCNNGIVQR